ncbi:MAG: tRNA-dihydrouridine synthase family protein [Bdellovibrionales bacterium]|nr:tRNA-dihydrouridine synthase family protein [Bdellovibrionales bacterium]
MILAPMEGITDAPMRAMLTEIGGFTHLVSEFIRVSQTVLPKRVFRNDIPECARGFRTETGIPVQPQLLGGHPERVARSALAAVSLGAPGIDLNFGCPAPTVNRNDGGATLLKYPERLEAIVRAVRDAVPAHLPVSAKLRLGWDDPSVVVENAKRAEAGGASWIAIHARTKTNGYQPPVYWEWIARAKEGVSVPVVANGDIWRVEDFRRCREITGAEHFMIGRSALADPWLGHRISQALGLAPEADLPAPDDLSAWLPHLERFAVLSARFSDRDTADGRYCTRRVKQWLRYSEATFRTPWFGRVKRTESLADLFAALPDESPGLVLPGLAVPSQRADFLNQGTSTLVVR